jgi:ribonuclease HII
MREWSIKEIKDKLISITDEQDTHFIEWMKDGRKGVQSEIKKWYKLQEKNRNQLTKFHEMKKFETELYESSITYIAGIDEVGRGPLAGPVLTAAVILPKDFVLIGLDDSKKLSKDKREKFYEIIKAEALSIAIGECSAEEIDRVNIYEATKIAMVKSIESLHIKPEHLLIDAMKLQTLIPQTSIIKGDSKSISIAAASVIAKVERDRIMDEYDSFYPGYSFSKHKGYGTPQHVEALQLNGISPIHRKSFAPIKNMISPN